MSPKKPLQTIANALRAAIETSGKSANQIGLEAGVSHAVILRFVSNERDLRLETADKIATVVGLSVASPSPSRKAKK